MMRSETTGRAPSKRYLSGTIRRKDVMAQLHHDLAYTYVNSPIGSLLLAGDGFHLHLISFPEGSRTRKPDTSWRRDDAIFGSVSEELNAYFAGEIQEFTVPLQLTGTTFQKTVWQALLTIPFGETLSYGALAKKIGFSSSSRAVGAANGANPIPIIIPCHRVIGANGSLTGFGGGIDTKRYLLQHERSPEGLQGQLL
jgi:methylated-DNA-[protein]-cysteine S-methyltransferase